MSVSLRVAIIGAGFSGLAMAGKMQDAGMLDFTVYEKAADVGGTWRENRYPGLTCDVPSRFYQYSFAPNPDWTHQFSAGPEIHGYLRNFVADRGLTEHIRFGTEVKDARWEDGRWHLQTADGAHETADVLVCATGVLHHPVTPKIPGMDSFEGHAFHSARWDDSVQVQGKRVAVIGTGSTGCQITGALAGVAGQLDVFQRSAHWVLYLPNWRHTRISRALLRRFPALNGVGYRLHRKLMWDALSSMVSENNMRRKALQACVRLSLRLGIKDHELRARLTPDHQPFCRRLIFSPTYYKAIQHPAVELVTEGIDRIEPKGIRTKDGRVHELDVIVFATGFDAHAYMQPMTITGRDGLTLKQAWADGPQAYRSVAMPGFPNLFTLQGPHSPVGNYSLVAIAENQVGFVMNWLERMRTGEVASASVTRAATDAYYEELYRVLPDTVWATGCTSWYLGAKGLPELWPWTTMRHREMLSEPVIEHFEIEAPTPQPSASRTEIGRP